MSGFDSRKGQIILWLIFFAGLGMLGIALGSQFSTVIMAATVSLWSYKALRKGKMLAAATGMVITFFICTILVWAAWVVFLVIPNYDQIWSWFGAGVIVEFVVVFLSQIRLAIHPGSRWVVTLRDVALVAASGVLVPLSISVVLPGRFEFATTGYLFFWLVVGGISLAYADLWNHTIS